MRRAFICPSKYVQGENELLNLGYFVRQYGTSALLVATKSSVKRVREALDATAAKFGVTFVETDFQGECSRTAGKSPPTRISWQGFSEKSLQSI